MENKTTKYTKEGYQALVDELNYLKGEKTEEIKKNFNLAWLHHIHNNHIIIPQHKGGISTS